MVIKSYVILHKQKEVCLATGSPHGDGQSEMISFSLIVRETMPCSTNLFTVLTIWYKALNSLKIFSSHNKQFGSLLTEFLATRFSSSNSSCTSPNYLMYNAIFRFSNSSREYHYLQVGTILYLLFRMHHNLVNLYQ